MLALLLKKRPWHLAHHARRKRHWPPRIAFSKISTVCNLTVNVLVTLTPPRNLLSYHQGGRCDESSLSGDCDRSDAEEEKCKENGDYEAPIVSGLGFVVVVESQNAGADVAV